MSKENISFDFGQEEAESVIINKLHENIQKGIHVSALLHSDKYLELTWDSETPRESAIIRMLALENLVDDVLAVWIKGYNDELKGKTQSFHYKISLLKSLNLIPCKIIDAFIFYNKIRNKFAHELENERL